MFSEWLLIVAQIPPVDRCQEVVLIVLGGFAVIMNPVTCLKSVFDTLPVRNIVIEWPENYAGDVFCKLSWYRLASREVV